MSRIDHIAGRTFHGRRGGVENAFSYSVDYILLNPETARGPVLFSRNRANLTSLRDRDHGGPPRNGRGVAWVRDLVRAHGFTHLDGEILLLTQPRVLGHVFNPVSFWLCHDRGGALRLVIAEVSNTFGDRHSYLCHRDDHAPIDPGDEIAAQKALHVSPFQRVEGGYRFRFAIDADRIDIRIDYRSGNGSLIATLAGPRRPLTNMGVLAACLRRPFGSRRVLALIHWQAVKLWWKGATYRPRPVPPAEEISR
jgi:DUF1365 family protein